MKTVRLDDLPFPNNPKFDLFISDEPLFDQPLSLYLKLPALVHTQEFFIWGALF
jgi:hypothetical protein